MPQTFEPIAQNPSGSGSLLIRTEREDPRALDPLTFIAGSALLLSVAMAACCVPARRAMSVEPIVALRQD